MSKIHAAIVTAENSALGMGHMQRMAAFADFLATNGKFKPTLVVQHQMSNFLQVPIADTLPTDTNIIIRDMRDSLPDEILALQKTAPVAAIDDMGEGRKLADIAIDLLPHPAHIQNTENYRPEAFIYGFNFINSLKILGDKDIPKTLDFAAYVGGQGEENMLALLPPELSGALLTGKGSFAVRNGRVASPIEMPYAKIFAQAKVVISHFGITIYEGALAGANIVTINPSEYHNSLAELAKPTLGLFNAGLGKNVELVKNAVRKAVAEPRCTTANPAAMLAAANKNMRRLEELVLEIC